MKNRKKFKFDLVKFKWCKGPLKLLLVLYMVMILTGCSADTDAGRAGTRGSAAVTPGAGTESVSTSVPASVPTAAPGSETVSASTQVPASVPTAAPGAETAPGVETASASTPIPATVPTTAPGVETASASTQVPASTPTAPPDNTGLEPESTDAPEEISGENANAPIDAGGSYTTAEDVALYLHTYGELPDNFITKKEANALGWSGGSLESYAPGKCIGGDKFGNYEKVLPDGNYHECDIDTLGAKKRGAKRLVYSDDGRIYYTEDHYETFTLLYGEE